MSGRGPGHLCYIRVGKAGPQSGPSCEGALLEGAVLWALTWWASHPHRAPAARVSLGASGPRKPPGTNSIWGEKRQQLDSSGLAQPRPDHAHTSTYHLEGSEGASGFLWFPAALGWGDRWGLVLPRVSAPAPPAAGPPWTPALRGPWRHIGELERLRSAWGSSWEPAAAWAGISLPPAHSHAGACSPLTHSPRRPPSPGLPWTAGEPQSGAGSSGAGGVGGTARSMTVSTATCGGRGRWGGYQRLTRDRPARPVEAGLGGQVASRTQPGLETRLTEAQNFIRSACGFATAQFITFTVGKSSQAMTATHAGF